MVYIGIILTVLLIGGLIITYICPEEYFFGAMGIFVLIFFLTCILLFIFETKRIQKSKYNHPSP